MDGLGASWCGFVEQGQECVAQEPGTTSDMAGKRMAAWKFVSELKCSGSSDLSRNSAFY